jgi:hypothetical protein
VRVLVHPRGTTPLRCRRWSDPNRRVLEGFIHPREPEESHKMMGGQWIARRVLGKAEFDNVCYSV